MLSEKFIKATNEYCTFQKHLNAPYMRKVLSLKDIAKANLTITSTGFYKLYINGNDLTKAPLCPYVTNPDSVLLYDSYDVTNELADGKNVLGFILGNGMVNCLGGYIWNFDDVPYRSAPAVAFALEIEHSDGTSEIIEADETIKCAPSPITFDDMRCGEHYDARLEQNGWNETDFDDSSWTYGIVADCPKGKKIPKDTDDLVLSRQLHPVNIFEGSGLLQFTPDVNAKAGKSREISKTSQYKPEENEQGYIYDFGENGSIIPTLKINGKKGQQIVLQFGEYVHDGKLSWENIDRFYPTGYTQRDIYICSGNGTETYTPSFTYHSAQYCLVIGLEKEQATEDLLTFNVLHSDIKQSGDFSCSDNVANRLQSCIKRSDISNFIYFPLDCPHREKNGWTGDAAISAEQFIRNYDIRKSIKQWMLLIRNAQREDGAIPGIVPTGGWGFSKYNGPAWDQVIVEIPYRIYQYYGDISLFVENADMILKYINYLTSFRDKNGLIDYGLGDYVQIGRPAPYHSCPTVVSSSIYAKYICEKAEFLFREANMPVQAELAGKVKAEFHSAIRKHLLDKNTLTIKGNCQCAQALGLYYGIFELGERKEAYNVLVDLIHASDDHFDCGVLGLRTVFHTLADFGNAELAYKMITRLDPPSYGATVMKYNLTTLMESFHEPMYYKLPSLNHHFLGDYSNFFMTDVAGLHINPLGDDPTHIEVKPAFVEGLTYAETFFNSIYGKITVRWDKTENGYAVKVDCPEEISCSLTLPSGYMSDTDAPRSYEYNFKGTVNVIKYSTLAKGNY